MGASVAEATAAVQVALGMPSPSASRSAREVLMQVESPSGMRSSSPETSLLEMAQLQANIVSSAEDWLPGATGILALSDLRAGQHCFLRVHSDLAFGASGLRDLGILPHTTLEYEVELIAVMTFEDASLDRSGNVMKKVICEGEGYDKPEESAEVTVTFEAHDGDSGALLVEEKSLVFKVCNGRFCSALEETVLTMKKGEVCEVRCSSPSTCTDTELKLSPGASSTTVFRVELREFEKIALHSLPDVEKIDFCEKRKEVGNMFIKEENWLRALKRYQHIINCTRYLEHWLDEGAKTKALKVRRACHANAAACHLKLKAWREASTACDAVLKEEPENVKALFRRSQASVELKEHREAVRDLRKVLELDKDNAQARQLLAKAKQSMKSEVESEKKMFSKMVTGSKNDASTEKVATSALAGAVPHSNDDEAMNGDADSCYYMVGAATLLAAMAAGYLWSSGRLHGRHA
jgi:FK506-binding protein 4/5